MLIVEAVSAYGYADTLESSLIFFTIFLTEGLGQGFLISLVD